MNDTRAKNILIITSDEMRSDVLACMGNPDVHTPNMDALAARGTIFEKHFAPFPKCVPSRCSMHTGRYTHTDGFRTVMGDNHLPKGAPNLGEFLRDQQGYETTVLGLNHVWHNDWFYGTGKNLNQAKVNAVDYQSFTAGPLEELTKKKITYPAGEQIKGPHIDELKEVDYDGLITGEHPGFSDEIRAEQVGCYFNEVRDPNKPFFLQVNLGYPHPPYKIHEPFYSMYDRDAIIAFPHDLPEDASLPLRAMREHRLGNDISEASLREIQAVYYGMVTSTDERIGEIIKTLDDQGLLDSTLIIFTADHGDFAGQYGLNEKWDAAMQDCLLKVPFIMAGPQIPTGHRVKSLSEHVDIPATIFDYFGFERPKDWIWHGESLLPMIKGEKTKEYVFADGGHEKAMRDRFDSPAYQEVKGKRKKATGGKQLTYEQCPDAMARCKMIRGEEWKLVIREVGGNELFHMIDDPQEMKNLYSDPKYAHVISKMQLPLIEWCLRTDTDRPYLDKFGA
jgi:arylsulfatase A-like enzyme